MKLRDLKVVYICPEHNHVYKERKVHMDALLTRIGVHQFEHFKSSTENYPDCLGQAIIEILKANMDQPVLILEDDVDFTGIDEFDMIEGADAIYFGLSTSAGSRSHNVCDGPAQYTAYSASQVRVQSMLGGHAILYVTAAYKAAVIRTISENFGQRYNTDVLMSRLHDAHVVLANRKPSFYQAARFNNNNGMEIHTRITFMDKPVETTVVTAFYPLRSKHSIEKYVEWMTNFCQIQCSLIIFTDEATAPLFEKLRKGLPTRIIVKHFGSYEITSPTMMDLWSRHHSMDPEKHKHTPELYAVWAMKQECVAATVQMNPFNTDWFVWCDAGIHRKRSKHNYYVQFPSKVPAVCKPGHIGFLEVVRIPDSFVSDSTGAVPNVTLGGGCIVGDRAAWSIFCNAYKAMLQTMDARSLFVGKDQTVFFRMLIERKMPFQLFQSDGPLDDYLYEAEDSPSDGHSVDPWMQFPCILAGTMPVVLDNRFNRSSYVKLIGGLGNQLFQIAAAYAHGRRSGASLALSEDVDHGHGRPSYYTTFLHQCKQFISAAPPVALYREPHFHYAAIPDGVQSLYGYYQSSRYFKEFSEEVKTLFDPHPVIKGVVEAKYGSFLEDKTVIVHVRRGDYMTEANKSFHGILTPLYYRAAMALCRERLGPDTKFLMLSDDIEYCRSIYGSDEGVTCIDEPNESVALHFMSQFQNYILSNSSFSWWASYLGKPATLVIAPDRWFGPRGPQDTQDIYEEGWIKLTAE